MNAYSNIKINNVRLPLRKFCNILLLLLCKKQQTRCETKGQHNIYNLVKWLLDFQSLSLLNETNILNSKSEDYIALE